MTLVKDTIAKKTSISNVQVACELLDVLPEELSGLPPNTEIEFCFDVVSNTIPTSISSYQVCLWLIESHSSGWGDVRNNNVEQHMWETEVEMRAIYFYLFPL